mgnify:CR=1 FL=1
MATLPAANYLTDNARTEGEFKAGLEAMLAATKQIPGAGTADLAYTIAAGSITPAGGGGVLVVETESLAASDDLANVILTNYPDGSMLLLRNNNAARVVVVKHAATGSGQILLDRNADYVLDDTKKYLLIQRRGTDWYEVLRGPMRASMATVAKTGNFTVTREDLGKTFVCLNSITVSFSAAATLGAGFFCTIINTNVDGATVTLDPNGSELADGRTTVVMASRRCSMLVCDGAAFYTMNDWIQPPRQVVGFSSSISVSAQEGDYIEVGTLTANITTFTITASSIGKRLKFRFVQDATGGRTVATPSGAKIAGSLASAANQASHLDLIFSFDGNRWEGAWTQIPV